MRNRTGVKYRLHAAHGERRPKGNENAKMTTRTTKRKARAKPKTAPAPPNDDADLGFERKLWDAANKLRGLMDAAEYKHVVLGLIFLKYISDAFEAEHARLQKDPLADPEDPDHYRAQTIFWVPEEARWSRLRDAARQPEIGKFIDDAMRAIERDNKSLKNVLPKDYARSSLDKRRLGQLVDSFSEIDFKGDGNRAKDILGRVYEYSLYKFATAEGRRGGEFYTPRRVVQLLVEMLAPYKGRVYDPCCGSGGMFVQSEKFVIEHASGNGNGGRAKDDISIYGQESNPTTWRLAKMNLAIRGIDNNLGKEHADSFHHDLHQNLKADYLLANPFFNMSDWGGEHLRDDPRWKYGVPPVGNANFAWVQHFIHHLAPNGAAGFVLANGSMSSGQKDESAIRKNIINADLVDCMVALPGQLFYSTQIPACLWFLNRNKAGARFRKRKGETLFIDARKLGEMVDRVQRRLTEAEVQRIAGTYHAWRGDKGAGEYADAPGFCKAVTTEEIARHDYVLTPGRYVGTEAQEDDGVPFAEKMQTLTAQLAEQMAEGKRLDRQIRANLKKLGFPLKK